MAAAAQEESITLKLEQQIDAEADKGTGALGRLERQTQREQNALGRLETNLRQASAQLKAMAAGAPDSKAVLAFEKQGAAVAALEAKMAGAGAPTAALTAKLAAAKAKLDTLKSAASTPVVNISAYKKQEQGVAALGDKVAAQRDKVATFGEKLKGAAAKADSTKAPLAAVAKSLKMVGGELGASEAKGVKFVHLLIKMGPALGLVVLGVAAASLAVGSYIGTLIKGISAAGAYRDENLKLAAAGVRWYDSSRASEAGALAVQNAITRVRASSALGREELAGYAEQLLQARFRGKQLETALGAMSIAGSAGRKDLADWFLQAATNTRYFGGSVDRLAARMKEKLGDVAGKAALSLGAQWRKLKDDIAYAFGGANIEPFLKGLQSALSIFSAGSKSATTMRDSITNMVERAIGAFLDMELAVGNWILSMPPGAFSGLSASLGSLAKSIIDLVPPMVKFVALIGQSKPEAIPSSKYIPTLSTEQKLAARKTTGIGTTSMMGFGGSAALLGLTPAALGATGRGDGRSLGKQIGQGVADGLRASATDAAAAGAEVAKAAIGGAAKEAEVHSPSRAMMRIGGFMGGGMAIGMHAQVGVVELASARLARAAMMPANDQGWAAPQMASAQPYAAPVAFGGAPAAGSKPEVHVHFHDCQFGAGTSMAEVEAAATRGVLKAFEADGRAA
jgi:hypothetical protein